MHACKDSGDTHRTWHVHSYNVYMPSGKAEAGSSPRPSLEQYLPTRLTKSSTRASATLVEHLANRMQLPANLLKCRSGISPLQHFFFPTCVFAAILMLEAAN